MLFSISAPPLHELTFWLIYFIIGAFSCQQTIGRLFDRLAKKYAAFSQPAINGTK
jgi:hypothetical protein